MPLYMVVERFKCDPGVVRARLEEKGRQFGPGLKYEASWMAENGQTCYQLMEAPSLESFDSWIDSWTDLVDFVVVPVQTSADFWANWTPGS